MKILFLLLIALLATACDDSKAPADAVKLDGIAAIGTLQSGTLITYDYSTCSKGEILAKVDLQNDEYFEFNIGARSAEHPILIELTNFTYKEQWSDQVVDSADMVLRSVAVVKPTDVEKRVNVSFWTNLAAARTAYDCGGIDTKAVEYIEQANSLFSAALTFDINEDRPVLVSSFELPGITIRELSGARYGIANAAVASYLLDFDNRNGDTAPHELYNSITLAEMAYSDLRFEGFLNGQNDTGEMQLGDILLNANVYRTDIPDHITAITRNLTNLPQGIEISFLSGVADSFHDSSTTGVFGFSEPTPLGNSPGPVLLGVTVSNCSTAIVGSCCGGLFKDPENVYRTTATVEFDVVDAYSTYEVTSISSNPTGIEYVLPLSSNITSNSIVPWRSGLRPVINFSQDSTILEIRSINVVFTNDLGKTLTVNKSINGQSCTI